MSFALYQLPGRPGYKPGAVVEVAGPHDRYGRVLSVIKEHYQPPNPSMADGPARLGFPCELTLYSIRGIGFGPERPAMPVWGFTT